MEQAFGSSFFGPSPWTNASPKANVFNEGDNYLVTLELPGLKKEDLNLEFKGSALRISGKRQVSLPQEASTHRRERSDYQFDRTLNFKEEIDPEKIKAELKDGVLAVLLPICESAKPKAILIG
ncbi:MAG: hypothetical protein A2600_00830 [Candidatus Lambdaproteobacteria bacterium RIFOXYD1_FULL_56_27]|uniref:SHSP domain-containing protein n=1 Tax=Candidatus Lambdaproteobacteria bacterium RIFOXYD2_FULL_56_26 TaxID=1817773 RepID=A0A1F6GLP2_9PROT|nr:MAG: hypothetical protein A2557_09690 [Candidatus Lambdaproteobacteria bacterium RIFOXYD2_FULL_56_26]OGH05676.1 MAG: hypothetical protein A2426_04040 [Candidatus Lambdaproteobacteria bacterium RIFOXYC1_FULL_56_13]OGH07098.1 MAG: hypothetical protein A2600_00830 [Candidatus Lambdaproteobacteria bacterium RIFOXYD1_FULL_56_27]